MLQLLNKGSLFQKYSNNYAIKVAFFMKMMLIEFHNQ